MLLPVIQFKMIKAKLILNEDTIIKGNYSKENDIRYFKLCKEIFNHFYDNKITLPIIPQNGMSINLSEFSNGLSEDARSLLYDGNDIHEIGSVIICSDYLELWF